MKRGINKQSTRGTIIIDLANPSSANKAIEEGLVVRGEIFNVELFHAECYIQQCFNCQGFGHIARNCRGTLKCGRCAAPGHETKACPDVISDRLRCANCEGKHAAWDKRCKLRKKEQVRAEEARTNRLIWFVTGPRSTSSKQHTATVAVPYFENTDSWTQVKRKRHNSVEIIEENAPTSSQAKKKNNEGLRKVGRPTAAESLQRSKNNGNIDRHFSRGRPTNSQTSDNIDEMSLDLDL